MKNKTLYTISLFLVSIFVWLVVVFAFTNELTFKAEDESSAPQSVVSVDGLEDGTYEGSGEGFGGPIQVAVEVVDGAIDSIEVLDHSESDGISDPALEELPSAMVEANGTDVDTVAGATVTSKGLIAAVNDALGTEGAETDADSAATSETDVDSAATSETTYKDGTYQGTAQGHEGDVEVEVTVEEGKISHVGILDHQETDGIADLALKQVPSDIVANNSSEVETVAGATYTSEAIMEATAQALEDAELEEEEEDSEEESEAASFDLQAIADGTYEGQAQGHEGEVVVEVEVKDHEITEVKVTEEGETQAIAEDALKEIPEAIVKANGTEDVEAISEATVTSNAILSAVEAALESAMESEEAEESKEDAVTYKDGKYKGEAEGFGGNIELEVEVKDGKIAAIEILKSDETEDISDPAFDQVPKAIIEANSPEVDTASGATVSSKAIIEAVEKALEEAK